MSSKIAAQQVSVTTSGSRVPVVGTNFLSGVAVYSDPILIDYSDGYSAVLALVSGASPDLDLYVEASVDGINWYRPYKSDGSQLDNIFTALTADRYQMIVLPLAKLIRFVIDPDADTTLTLKFINKEFVS